MTNWIVIDRLDDPPSIYATAEQPVGPLPCGCCVVFATRKEAVTFALRSQRGLQQRILHDLAECENVIVSYMQELNITTEEEKNL
jgi:hypothetical protein